MSILKTLVTISTGGLNLVGEAALRYITPELPKGAGTGDPLQTGSVAANVAKPDGVIPDQWGRTIRYPEKINATRTYYADERTEVTENLLCVGVGDVRWSLSDIRIGSTSAATLGADFDHDRYAPGADLSSDDRSRCWYNAPELAGGLDLAASQPTGSAAVADSASFAALSASLTGTGATIPESWVVGTIVTIQAPTDAVVSQTSSGVSEFVADWQDVEPFVGMRVTVSTATQDFSLVVSTWTDNGGTDDALTFTDDNGTPFGAAPSGAYRVAIGYRGHQYQLTAVGSLSVSFVRLTDAGAVDSGWSGFTARTVSDFELSSDEAGAESWIGPFFAVPVGQTTTLTELCFSFPSGLIEYDKDDGDSHSLTLDVEVEWRDAATGGAWMAVSYSFTGKTPDGLGYTRQIDHGAQIRPEIRVRRVQAEADTKYKTKRWKCNWLRLKALLPFRPLSYPDVTIMAVTTTAGDRMSALAGGQISVIASRYVDGVFADSISGFINYVREDVGMPAGQVDSAAIAAAESSYWAPRGESFDYSHDTQETVEDVLTRAAAAGMAIVTDASGVLSVHREGPAASVGLITPHDMTDDLSVSLDLDTAATPSGVDVTYLDPDTWTTQTVQCRLFGVTDGPVESLSLDGVQSRTRAWRIGMRQLRQARQRPLTVAGTTLTDVRAYPPYARVTVTDDVPLNGVTALVYGYSDDGVTATLTVQEPLYWESFTAPRVLLRDHDGGRTGVITPTALDRYFVRVPVAQLGFVPVTDGSIERARLMLCESAQIGYDVTLTTTRPNGLNTEFSAVEYLDDYYADDDNDPPE